MNLDLGSLSTTLRVMLYGMAGIFLVLIIIAGCVKFLGALFPDKGKK